MPAFNSITIIGRLTRDPEMKYTPQGVAVANLSLAVDKWQKDDAGNHETNFFNVILWRKSAEFASNYLKKGHLALVTGSMDMRKWTDKEGQPKTTWELNGEKVQSLQARSQEAEGEEAEPEGVPLGGRGGREPAKTAAKKATVPTDDNQDDDPFSDE